VKASHIGPLAPGSLIFQNQVKDPLFSSLTLIKIESSSEDDEAGPSPFTGQPQSVSIPNSSLPLGLALEGPEEAPREKQIKKEAETDPSNGPVREEWLLTPGERKPFGGTVGSFIHPSLRPAEALSTVALGNRKFDRGKQSKKAAEVVNAESEKAYEAYLLSAEGQQTEELLRQHREKRGLSLIEVHRDNSSKKPKNLDSGLQFFDRERVCLFVLSVSLMSDSSSPPPQDLLSHRRMDRSQVDHLVENSKQLDSRFSKTAVQRSFL
jgi:hypothetical protein